MSDWTFIQPQQAKLPGWIRPTALIYDNEARISYEVRSVVDEVYVVARFRVTRKEWGYVILYPDYFKNGNYERIG